MGTFSVLWSGKYVQCWENRLHSHDYFQIISLLKGSGSVQIGDKTFPLEKQGIYLIHPRTPHGIFSGGSSDLPQLADIKFRVADDPLARQVEALPAKLEPENFDNFQYYFQRILRESEQALPYSYERICMYFGLAMTRILRNTQQKDGETLLSPEEQHPQLQAVARYIQENYTAPISLEELVKISYLSKNTLIRLFRQLYATTPTRYINGVRLEKAKTLLLNTDSPINQIAEAVGFQSPQYFSRYFKSVEGMSPWEYRQRYSQNYFYTYRKPIQAPPK